MKKMAMGTGKEERASYYKDMFDKIRAGIFAHYKNTEGNFICDESAYGDGSGYIDGNMGFDGHTQTSYANAIYMNFYLPGEETAAGKKLAELIQENDGKISAGFLGTKPMLPALSKTGHSKLAYDLFLSTEYPSWGFEIVSGATTIWERWNSYTHEDGFGGERNASMNSFNHYAFGAVCEWMFGNAAGIKAASPAYRSVIVRPEPDKRLEYLDSEYQSISGTITSSWKYEDNGLSMKVTIPVNVSAVIYVPAATVEKITENGKPANKSEGLDFIKMEDGYAVFNAGSGSYSFMVKN